MADGSSHSTVLTTVTTLPCTRAFTSRAQLDLRGNRDVSEPMQTAKYQEVLQYSAKQLKDFRRQLSGILNVKNLESEG